MNILQRLLRRVISSMSILLALMVFVACSNDSSTNSNSQDTAKIQGYVTNDAGFGKILAKSNSTVEGAIVTVTKINTDGSLETVSNNSVETNASGEFVVETDVDGEVGLIVKAVKGNSEWKAVVSSMVEVGNTTNCQPLTDESTVEAEIEEETRSRRNNGSSEVTYADIAATIDADISENIIGDTAVTAELAAAIETEVDAYHKAMTSSFIGVSESNQDIAMEGKLEAQRELELNLYNSSGNEASINASYKTYFDAIADACSDANISSTSHAKATAISSKALINGTTNIDGQVSFLVEKSSNRKRAEATGRATEEQFSTIGATNAQLGIIANANANLMAEINSSGSRNEIEAAFDTYHDAIINELKVSFGANANAITTIDANINGILGAKIVLDTALSASVSTETIIDAYIEFYNTTQTLVEAILVGASETEINAITEILFLVNISV